LTARSREGRATHVNLLCVSVRRVTSVSSPSLDLAVSVWWGNTGVHTTDRDPPPPLSHCVCPSAPHLSPPPSSPLPAAPLHLRRFEGTSREQCGGGSMLPELKQAIALSKPLLEGTRGEQCGDKYGGGGGDSTDFSAESGCLSALEVKGLVSVCIRG
jgi:hypothetical protein